MSTRLREGEYLCQLCAKVDIETKRLAGLRPECVRTKNGYPQISLPIVILAVRQAVKAGVKWRPLPERLDRRMYLGLSAKAIKFTKPVLIKLGFNGKFRTPVFDAATRVNHTGYKPGEIAVRCTHDVYSGRTRETWDLACREFSLVLPPATEEQLMALDAMWADPGNSLNPEFEVPEFGPEGDVHSGIVDSLGQDGLRDFTDPEADTDVTTTDTAATPDFKNGLKEPENGD